MKIVQPEVHIENQDWVSLLHKIETKGRVCYKSEERMSTETSNKFVEDLIKRGHLSVLEHSSISVKFIVDRGVSHEIVRHRLASYSQESTRYCNYGHEKEITVIEPFFLMSADGYALWEEACESSEEAYLGLLAIGHNPQEARSVLPNSLKTEIWMTANIREWMHFCTLRAAKTAHPQMRQVAIPLPLKLREFLPLIFGGVDYDQNFPEIDYAEVFCGGEVN